MANNRGQQWQGNRAGATALRFFAFILPLALSLVFALWLSRIIPSPESLSLIVVWWLGIMVASTIVLRISDRFAKRLLPLAVLMKLSLVFPDQAPSRFSVALKSGNTTNLQGLLDEAEEAGRSDDLASAAATILALAAALNSHDPRTRGHVERVRAYADMIAEEMGYDEEERNKIKWAAMLHDIGKLRVPTEIINKPGKLEEEEWAVMRRHPEWGMELSAPLHEWLGPFVGAIGQHHEKFNGSGYPLGISGEEIAMAARITAVADAFDVMTSVRSYKEARPTGEAREELARSAGSHFDPAVVRAFLNVAIGRQRWVAGPLSWLAQVPFFQSALQTATSIATQAGTAAAAGTAAVAITGASVVAPSLIETPTLATAANVPNVVVEAPTAQDDSVSINEDNSVSVTVLANDSVAGPTATVTIISPPAHGTAYVDDRRVVFTPHPDFVGKDTLVYEVCTAAGCDQGTLVVSVAGLNDAPVWNDAGLRIEEDAEVIASVLDWVTDPDGDLLIDSLRLMESPDQGSTRLEGDTLFYLPPPDFHGSVAFRFEICDAAGTCVDQQVDLVIEPVNDPPIVAEPIETYGGLEDELLTIPILEHIVDPDGDPLDVVAESETEGGGTVTVADGILTYQPADNYSGDDAIAATISDGAGGSLALVLIVSIDGANDPPIVPGPGPLTTNEDTTFTFDPLAGATDPDGEPFEMTSFDTVTEAGGSVTEGSLIYTPPPDYHGPDRFLYTVRDAAGATTITAVDITVTPVNDPPVVAPAAPQTLAEDGTVSLYPLAGASDVDGDTLTVSAAPTTAQGGTVTVAPDGTVTYTPADNFVGTDEIEVTVEDGAGGAAAWNVEVTVLGEEDPPTGVADSATVAEDSSVTVDVTANDTDAEDGVPAGTVTILTAPSHGTAVVNGDRTITYVPAADYAGPDGLSYAVTDSAGLASAPVSVTLTVTAVNDPPTVPPPGLLFVTEDTAVVLDALAAAFDPDGDLLTVAAAPASAEGGIVEPAGPGLLRYTPPLHFAGDDSFTYTVTDAGGIGITHTATVAVSPVEDAPAAADDSAVIAEDGVVTIPVADNDADPEDGIPAGPVTIATGPGNGAVVVNPDRSLTYTPDPNWNGTDTFTYTITDSAAATSTPATVTITVTAVNDLPIAGDDTATTNEDTNTTITVVGNDTDVEDGIPAGAVTIASAPVNGAVIVNPDRTVTYAPAAEWSGVDTFTYTVADGDGATSTPATVTVTVNAVNDLPVANNDTATTNEDTDTTITVVANDTDVEDGAPTGAVTIATAPSNGAAVVNPDRTVTYTPDPNWSGVDTVTYTITDSDGATSTPATVTITVTAINDLPIAGDDTPTTNEDTDTTITVVANDTDVEDGIPAGAVTITSSPGNGFVTINPDRTVTYTPDPNWNGTDTFTYTVTDGDGATSAPATVTITVTAVNDDPVAAADTATTNEDTDTTITVVANDTDVEDGVPAGAVTIASPPTNGSISVNPDRTITYTPDPDWNGTDTFTYTIDDGDGATSGPGTVILIVIPVNDSPSANGDIGAPIVEDSIAIIDVVSNDTDVEDGIPAGAVTIASAPVNGAVIVNPDRTVTYAPAAEWSGVDTFTYTVADGDGATSTPATVTVTVNAVNDLPVANNDTATTNEDTDTTITVVANDTDVEDGAPTGAVTIATAPSNGAAVVNPDRTVTYTPDPNWSGVDTVTYTITDSDGATSTPATVTITVTAINDLPIAGDDTPTTNEDTDTTITVVANDTDVEDGIPAGAVTITSSPGNGFVTINPDRTVTYTPDPNWNGTDTFTYTVTDGDGATSAPATVTITVTAVNDDPVAAADTATTNEDTDTTITVVANDTDVEDGVPAGAVTIASPPTNGSISVNPDRTITYTPDPDWNGTEVFTYVVRDSDGAQSTAVPVTVTVDPVNDPPVVNDDAYATLEDTSKTFSPLANDIDAEDDLDAGSLTIVTPPTSGTASVLPGSGVVQYVPDPNSNGADTFTYSVCDAAPACGTATVTITVTPVNDLPVAADDGAATIEDTGVIVTVVANDADVEDGAPTGAVTIATDPGNGAVAVNPDRTITYTPDPNWNGTDTFTYTITDSDGATSTPATVTVTVTAINDDPAANNDTATTNEDTDVIVTVVSNDSDVEDGVPTGAVGIASAPTNGSISVNPDRTITYTPDPNWNGIDTFTYTITDAAGATSTPATVTVTVTAINDLPVAGDDTATTDEDTDVIVTVVSNDSDVEDGVPTGAVTIASAPTNGSISVNPDRTVTYTPDPNWNGIDTFTYTIADAAGATSTPATVTVTVTAINDLPVANNDTTTTDEDIGVIVTVVANDSDVEDGVPTGAVTIATAPTNGSVVVNPDRTITYTPDPNWNGADTFTYTITDSDGATSTPATVTVTVTAINDLPVANNDTTTTDEDIGVIVTVVANDSDVEDGVPTGAVTIATAPTNGSVVVNPDRTVTYTPDPNWNGTDTFTYTIADAAGATSTPATVTVTVTAINDLPVANNDTTTTDEDTGTTITVVANDTDVEDGVPTGAVTIATAPTNGSVVVNPDRTVTYTPDPNWSGIDTFTYTIADSDGATSTPATVTVTVTAVNDDPVANNDVAAPIVEDADATITVVSNDSDVEDGVPTGAVTIATGPTNGSVVVNPDRTVTYTPDPNWNGIDTFTYTITDSAAATSTPATVTVTVNAVNDLPVANNDVAATDEDTLVAITVVGNDTDVEDGTPTGAVGIATGPSNGAAVVNPDRTVTYTPDPNWNGIDTFTYTITDSAAATSTPATVTITVNAVNDDPVAVDDSAATNEDTGVIVTVVGNDTDVEDGVPTGAVGIATGPSNGAAVVNPDRTITYTPDPDWNGIDTFTYIIDDGDGATSDPAAVAVTVNTVNDLPVAADDTAATDEDTLVTITVLDNDTDAEGFDFTTLTVTSGPGNGVATPDTVTGTIDYTPAAAFNGIDTFTYEVADTDGVPVSASVTVYVGSLKAVNDPATVAEDGSVDVDVLANDRTGGVPFASPDPVTVVASPDHGAIDFVDPITGVITYTPDPDWFGTDTFTYQVERTDALTDTATVSVTVTAVNDDPVAAADAATTAEDADATVTVVTNDTDVEDGTPTGVVAIATAPGNGSAVVNPDRTITYTPDPNWNGIDTFTYTIDDAAGATSASAPITITVTALNDDPVAADDTATTDEDTGVIITVVTNDSDVEDGVPGGAVAVATGPTNGSVVVNPDRTITYTPDPNWSGVDTFTYTIDDAAGATSTPATVTITVNALNDDPVANDDVAAPIVEDTPVTITVVANDSDVEDGTPTGAVAIATGPTNGSVVVNPDRTVTYTPDADWSGVDTFTYTVDDAAGATSTPATVTITVNAVNDDPVAADDTATTNEDTNTTITVVGNDSDVEDGTPTGAVTIATGPSNGSVVVNPDRTVTYTPDPNWNGIDTFTYTVDDAAGATSTPATVTITVNAVNDDPVAADDTATTNEDTNTTITVVANDSDVEDGTPTGAVTIATGPSNGAVIVNPDRTVTYTPDPNWNGIDTFTYTIDDAAGATSTPATVTITVNAVNDDPIANPDTATTNEDTNTTITVVGNDSDVEDGTPTGAVTIATGPSNGSVVVNPDRTVTYTPDPNWNGIDTFTYTVDDAAGATSTPATVTITVTAVNDDPVANNDVAAPIVEDAGATITVVTNDTDVEDGTPTGAVTIATAPTNGSVVVNPDRTVTYTPDPNWNGIDTFTYTIDDGDGATSTPATVTVTVNAVNDDPIANPDTATTNEDTGVIVTVAGNDTDIEDGVPAGAVTIDTAPTNGAVVVNPDRTVTYTPDPNWNGVDTFTYTIDDDAGATSGAATATVTVVEINDDPVAADDTAFAQQDQPAVTDISSGLLSNDTDVDGDPVAFDSVASPSVEGGTVVDNGDGTLTYTPPVGFIGTDSFTYTVADGRGGFDTGQVSVDVNGKPTATDDGFYLEFDQTGTFTALANDSDPQGDLLSVILVDPGINGGTTVIEPDSTISYTPPEGYTGPDSFAYTISDGRGGTDAATVTVTVADGLADLTLAMTVASDPATEGESVTYSLTIDSNGPRTAANATLTDTLPAGADFVSATSTRGSCLETAGEVTCGFGTLAMGQSAVVTITVDPTAAQVSLTNSAAVASDWTDPVPGDDSASLTTYVNALPVTAGESFTVAFGTPLMIDIATGLLGNDSDPEGSPLSLGSFDTTTARGGTVVDNGDGTLTYTSPGSFAGPDRFLYEACDPDDACSSATALITVLDPVLYLRSSGVTRQNVLPLTWDEPTAVLTDGDADFDYDTDLDPGLTIRDGGALVTEGDPEKRQYWDITLAKRLILSGPADLTFFSLQDNFDNAHEGIVFAYLLDCASSADPVETCTQIGSGTVASTPWDTINAFTAHEVDFGTVSADLAAGRVLRLVVTVDKAHNGKLWFGFDTTTYPSALGLKVNGPPTIRADVLETGLAAPLAIAYTDLTANDEEPDVDPILFASADGVSAAGGTITDDGFGALTYTPPPDFSGLDTFSYVACDSPFNQCGTATVSVAVGRNVYFLGTGAASATARQFAGPVTTRLTDGDDPTDFEPDSDPGLTISKSRGESDEDDPTKIELWQLPPATEPLDLSGGATLDIWVTQNDWKNEKKGEVTAHLLDCAGDETNCVPIATGSLLAEPWATERDFVRVTVDLGDVVATVDPGRMLRLMVMTTDTPVGKLWYAFDDVDHPAVLTIGFEGPPITHGDVYSVPIDTPLAVTTTELKSNDINPSGGPLTVTVAASSNEGGTVVDVDGTNFTYTPAPGYTGSDSFTYDLCDAGARCDTATVSVAVGTGVWFLGSDGTTRQDVLPVTGDVTATLLADYESDLDPGLTIAAGDGTPFQTDPTKRQLWNVTAPAGGIDLSGPTTLTVWSQQDNGENTLHTGTIAAHLLDCAGTYPLGCTLVDSTTLTRDPWGTPDNEFLRHVLDFGEVYYPVVAGNELIVELGVDVAHNNKLWFAFDTVEYPTVLTAGFNGQPVGGADVFATDNDTLLAVTAPEVLGNDTDPDGDTLHVGRVDAVSAAGGVINDGGMAAPIPSFTYTPAPGFTGLDSFTYDTCDDFYGCGTTTVRVAVGEDTLFLGSDGLTRVDVLPFTTAPTVELDPTDPALDYDSDLDPGLTIKAGAALFPEPDPLKRQWWDLPTGIDPYEISGEAVLTFWSAQDGWVNTNDGLVRAFLLDCRTDGADCQQVAVTDTTLLTPWGTNGGYVRHDVSFGTLTHRVDPGRMLRLMVTVDVARNGTMWFAHDTVDYPAVLSISRTGPPVAYGDVLTAPNDTTIAFTATDLTNNDINPSDGPLTLTVPAASTEGGTVVDVDGTNFTYTPPPGYTGLDTLTYTVCDAAANCDTATVSVAVGEVIHFLGSDGTTRQDLLPLTAAPTATILPDYDTDLDPGLTIAAGDGTPFQTDPTKRQLWNVTAPAGGIDLSGPTTLTVWSQQDNGENTLHTGTIAAHLLDCAGTYPLGCTLVDSTTLTRDPWGTPDNEFLRHVLDFGEVYYPVVAGNELIVELGVDVAHNNKLWFAFDTVEYPTVLTAGFNGQPVGGADVFATDNDTLLAVTAPEVLGNDTDPDGDTLHVGRVDAVSAAGGVINDGGMAAPIPSFTYTPAPGFTGLDSFTYDTCDDFYGCGTTTVRVAVGEDTLFLGSDGLTRVDVLPFTTAPTVELDPTDPALDYDSDLDPGLTIKAGAALFPEPDPLKRQWWDLPTGIDPYEISGEAVLTFWSAQDGWVNTNDGLVRAFLLDCRTDGADCQQVAVTDTTLLTPWGTNGGYVRHDVSFGTLTHRVDPGRMLRLMVTVDVARNGTMWFAHDTVDYPAVLSISRTGPPVAYGDVLTAPNDTTIAFTATDLTNNDINPSDGPLTLTVPAASTEGGTVVDVDGTNFTYTPPPGYTGLDTLTYTVCDAAANCDTATVSVAVGEVIHFLGSDGTTRQDLLPLTAAPTATILPDYDTDLDPGLTIAAGDGTPFQTDPTKRQLWNVTAPAGGIDLSGPTTLTVWSQQDNGENTLHTGTIAAHLLDCAGTYPLGCTLVDSTTLTRDPWGTPDNEFLRHVLDFGEVYYPVVAGNELIVELGVDVAHNNKLWFAFDTVEYPTVLTAGFNGQPVGGADVFATDNDTLLAVTAPEVLGNDTDPDGDTLHVGRVDAVSAAGGVINDGGMAAPIPSFTYTPAPGFTGLDSFTYDTCDDFYGCGTTTVRVAVGEDTLFLGSDGLTRVDVLPFTTAPTVELDPTDPALDYDSDLDPGLTIKAGAALFPEPDPLKRQWWDLPTGIDPYEISGEAVLTFWSAQDGWVNTNDGLVRAFLLDCRTDGADCQQVAVTDTTLLTPWGTNGGYVRHDVSFGTLTHRVDPGRMLRLMVTVDVARNGTMWFAHDTVDYPAVLSISRTGPPVAYGDVLTAPNDTTIAFTATDLTNNDINPSDGPLTLTVPAASTEGGTVVDVDGTNFTYTPPPGYTGLDTLTYTVCDAAANCDTATVSVAVGEVIHFLGSDGTTRQDLLPLTAAPTATILPDYDTDLDPGLTIAAGDGTPFQTDPTKRQLWNVTAPAGGIDLSGPTTLTVWSQQDNGENTLHTGTIAAHLLDCAGTYPLGCTLVDSTTLTRDPWGTPDNEFLRHVLDFGDVYHTVSAGDSLIVELGVDVAHNNKLWFAFDTVEYPTVLTAGFNGQPVTAPDLFTDDNRSDLVITTAALTANDADPDGDPITITRVDVTGAKGGTITDNGDGTWTYVPATQLWNGVDSFTYDICDPFSLCDTAVVQVAVGDDLRFLGSVGDHTSRPLSETPPAAILDIDDPAFDVDGDGKPGLSIKKFNSLAQTTEMFQYWEQVLTQPVTLEGTTSLTFWAALKDFNNGGSGDLEIRLRDCDSGGGGCSTLAIVNATGNPWGTAGEFVEYVADFGTLDHAFAAGRMIELRFRVLDAGGGHMWFALNTVDYPAVLASAINQAPDGVADVYTTGDDNPLPLTVADLMADDADPDGDPLTFAGADAATTAGGTVTDEGGGDFTYAPPAGFVGSDSFTYDVCDPFGRCTTSTVHIAVGEIIEFFGSAGTTRVDSLPFAAAPTVALDVGDPAFDFDSDGKAGLTIKDGDGLSIETDPTKRQWWDLAAATDPIELSGPAIFTAWSVQDGFNNNSLGIVNAYLLECDAGDTDGSTCVELAAATVSLDPWDTADELVAKRYDFGDVYRTIPAGRMLRAMIAVDKARNGKMYFGFDTADYPTVLTVGANGTPVAAPDILDTGVDAARLVTVADWQANDVEPDGDPMALGTVDAVSTAGGTITDHGDETFTYTPVAGYAGLDSFSYSVCDPMGLCDTATVWITVADDPGYLTSSPAGSASYALGAAPTVSLADDDPAFDYDIDGRSGYTVRDGNGLSSETDPAKRVWWDRTATGSAINLAGNAAVTVWSVQDGFVNSSEGIVNAYLLDCAAGDTDGSTCVEFAAANVSANPWATVDGYVQRVYDFGSITHTVPDGRVLRVMLAVDKANGGRMLFGFDTVEYPSVAAFDLS